MLEALLGNSKSRFDSYINTCKLHSNKYLFSYSSHLIKTCCTYANTVGHTSPAAGHTSPAAATVTVGHTSPSAATVRSLLSETVVCNY